MKRKNKYPHTIIVTVTERQSSILTREAERKHIRRTELIRRIVDEYIDRAEDRRILRRLKPTLKPYNERMLRVIINEWIRSWLQ